MGKAFCIDLGARLSVRSLISALLTALTSAECTLASGNPVLLYKMSHILYVLLLVQGKKVHKVSFLIEVRRTFCNNYDAFTLSS